MHTRLLSLLVACLFLIGATTPGKLLRAGEQVDWSMGDGRKAYRLGDVTALFDRVQCAPLGPECEEEDLEPKLTLTLGGKSITLDVSPSSNQLMLGRIAKGGPVVAFLQSYTGGMHCCREMRVILPGAAGPAVVALGAYDGAEIGWPRDLDGDGNLDLVVSDDRFLYAFESYAASVAPPKILNVVDGAVRDVSAEPRFAKVFEQAAKSARKACIGEDYPNGACAAWAASAARLGRLEAVWPVILAEYRKEPAAWPDHCQVERGEDGACPEGQLVEYPDYPTGLRAYLAELGYIPPHD